MSAAEARPRRGRSSQGTRIEPSAFVWDESLLSQIEIADLNSKWGKKCAAATAGTAQKTTGRAACPRPLRRPVCSHPPV